MKEAVEKALTALRPGLQADGADVMIDKVEGTHIYLRLIIDPEACAHCLLPGEHYQKIFKSVIADEIGTPVTVHLDDPRGEQISWRTS